jgi:hypothetical protein
VRDCRLWRGDELAVGGAVADDYCRRGMFSGGVDFICNLLLRLIYDLGL